MVHSTDAKQYMPLSDEKWKKQIETLNKIITAFVIDNGYNIEDIIIDESALFQIITKVDQRKQYFLFFHHLDVSDFKELALNCFWIIKLKPIVSKQPIEDDEKQMAFSSINEKFVVYYIIKEFRALLDVNRLPQIALDKMFNDEYIYELIYSFTYRDISKEAMILLMETIALSVGLNPYLKN